MDRISRVPVWARPPTATEEHRNPVKPPKAKSWAEHRANLRAKYPGNWSPSKKVSREAMDAIRKLHKADPDKYPTWILAQRFTISPVAVRRILKSKWRMPEDKVEEKIMKERMRRIERMKRMREEEMHQMVRAGIKLKVHPDDELRLK
jgi:methylphosphotriester-DNA--protein-cysteine methyltransferase